VSQSTDLTRTMAGMNGFDPASLLLDAVKDHAAIETMRGDKRVAWEISITFNRGRHTVIVMAGGRLVARTRDVSLERALRAATAAFDAWREDVRKTSSAVDEDEAAQ
jgi:hypothetical protein